MKKIVVLLIVILIAVQVYSQNFWQQTNGPYGGATVRDFLSYRESNFLLATDEGLIRSTNMGETWERILTSKINCLAIDSVGTLYAGENYLSNNFFLLKSTDEGDTWNRMNLSMWPDVRQIFVTYKDTIFLATWNKGVCRSTDGGSNWVLINDGIEYTKINTLVRLSNNNLLVGSDGGGVYKSTNFGENWTQSNSGLPTTTYKYANSFCQLDNDEILLGTRTGIYYSTDSGDFWTGRSVGYGNDGVSSLVKDNIGYIYAGANLNDGVYRSSNNGESWVHIGLNNHVFTLGLDPSFNLYAGVLSSGLYKFALIDSTWNQVYNKGYSIVEVDKICVTESENLIVNTHWWAFQYSSDIGETWNKINFSSEIDVPILSINDSIIITGRSSGVYVSNDSGKTWILTLNNIPSIFYYDPSRELIYLGTNGGFDRICGIYISEDFGQTWSILHEFEYFTNIYRWIEALHISTANQKIFATVVYSDHFGQSWVFYKSTDFGQSWESILPDNNIYSTLEDRNGNIYAAAGTKLFVSTDEGDSWISRSSPHSDYVATDFSGKIYIAKNLTVYYSSDSGITWNALSNLGLKYINDIAISEQNKIYLATTAGLFIGHIDSIILGAGTQLMTIKSFLLSQNYPNPFNPSTIIIWQVPVGSWQTLKVYDVLGREVATLVDEEKQPGVYEVEFNSAGLASGIYYYQLKAGSYVETKKMVLLK